METKGGQFGGKNKAAIVGIIKERLFSEPVTREKDFFFGAIINRERPHPIEFFQQAWAPFPVSIEQNLGIGMICFKTVTSGLRVRRAARRDCKFRR